MYESFADKLKKKIQSNPIWVVKKDLYSANGIFHKGTYITEMKMKVLDYDYTEYILSIHSCDMQKEITETVSIKHDEFDDYFGEDKELVEKLSKFEKADSIKNNILSTLIFVFLFLATAFLLLDVYPHGYRSLLIASTLYFFYWLFGYSFGYSTERKDNFLKKLRQHRTTTA